MITSVYEYRIQLETCAKRHQPNGSQYQKRPHVSINAFRHAATVGATRRYMGEVRLAKDGRGGNQTDAGSVITNYVKLEFATMEQEMNVLQLTIHHMSAGLNIAMTISNSHKTP